MQQTCKTYTLVWVLLLLIFLLSFLFLPILSKLHLLLRFTSRSTNPRSRRSSFLFILHLLFFLLLPLLSPHSPSPILPPFHPPSPLIPNLRALCLLFYNLLFLSLFSTRNYMTEIFPPSLACAISSPLTVATVITAAINSYSLPPLSSWPETHEARERIVLLRSLALITLAMVTRGLSFFLKYRRKTERQE